MAPDVIAQIELMLTYRPLNSEALDDMLPDSYPDKEFLMFHFRNGARVCPVDVPPPFHCGNYRSATDMIPRAYVDIQLRDEIIEHKVWDCCWKSDYTHAIGGILRPETDDIRITHDYGRPLGTSINDNTIYLKMKWDSFDSLTDLVTKGSWIARADIRWYYRHFPVDP